MSNPRKSIKPASSACHTMGHAMNATSCPATSSITTCEGSFWPQPRASKVAAGIPIATASAISSTITGTRAKAGRCEASSHQSNVVASEVQVPGPGRNRPTPKNVATSVAQRGAARSPASLGLLEWLVGIAGMAGLRIVKWAGDDIAAARPFAQVNGTAAFAAERKLRIAGQHDLPAGWASQAANAFLHGAVAGSQWSVAGLKSQDYIVLAATIPDTAITPRDFSPGSLAPRRQLTTGY